MAEQCVTGTKSPAHQVASIRLPAEHVAADAVASDYLYAKTHFRAKDPASQRRLLLSEALLLTETMAPEPYAVGRDVLATLGVDARLELYQSSGRQGANAQLVLSGDPIGVEFVGGFLVALERPSLAAVLGHEIGHALAHDGNAAFAWLGASTTVHSRNRDVYALASELTADRFGLLACRDLDAALRLHMHSMMGPAAPILRLDTASYLRQCRALGEDTLAEGSCAHGRTHPEHYIRGYALWLFSETDLYASLTGKGPRTRRIAEVNATLEQLIGVSHCVSMLERRSRPAANVSPPKPQRATVVSPSVPEALAGGAEKALAATRDALADIARRVWDELSDEVRG